MNIKSNTYELVQKILKEHPDISVGDVGRIINTLDHCLSN